MSKIVKKESAKKEIAKKSDDEEEEQPKASPEKKPTQKRAREGVEVKEDGVYFMVNILEKNGIFNVFFHFFFNN